MDMLKSVIPSRKLVPLQTLNREASKKENQLNQKLDQLSNLFQQLSRNHENNHGGGHNGSSSNSNSGNNNNSSNENNKILSRIRSIDREITSLLNDLESLNRQMNESSSSTSSTSTSSTSSTHSNGGDGDGNDAKVSSDSHGDDEMIEVPVHMRQQIVQHGQTLNTIQRELKQIRRNIQKFHLLNSPNGGGVGEMQPSSSSTAADPWTSDTNRALMDRDLIVDMDRVTNRLLEQGHDIRGNMSMQRMLISGANAKLGGMRARFPVIDHIIGRIHQKRQRDMIILSFFIAFCIIVTWFLIF